MSVLFDVTYPSGESSLREIDSLLCSPDASEQGRPLVLILRGVAGPMDGYIEIAMRMADWGYHALIHNWQARGNDPADEIVQKDLEGVLRFIANHPVVGASRLFVMGFCRGGIHAFFAASQSPKVEALVVFHGFCYRAPAPVDLEHKLQPIDLVPVIAVPVLLLHGIDDSLAPIASLRELHRRLETDGVVSELHEYAGADHGFAVSTHPGFEPAAATAAFSQARAFLTRQLAAHPQR